MDESIIRTKSGTLIDRRLDGKNKSTVNRQRFIRRFKSQIRKAVTDSLSGRSITEIDDGERVNIPAKDLTEPVFGHGSGGHREVIHPGNKEFVKGDRMRRPQRGSGRGGSGSGQASDSGEGEDDFVFELSREEFLELFFEDLELPRLLRKELAKATEFKSVRAGFSTAGSNLNVEKTLERALARRIALGAQKHRRRLREAEEELSIAQGQGDLNLESDLLEEIEFLKGKLRVCPFVDPSMDARFVLHTMQPQPTTQAVMFCIMDVSGSMDRARKDLAKRFFTLLYLFLKRNYEKIEVVFIRHTTTAEEVDEQEFFYGRNTGGTKVSSALRLMVDVQRNRYPDSEWNVYVAQASDGDDCHDDPGICKDIIRDEILKIARYFAYVEIAPDRHQKLWEVYEEIKEEFLNFAMRQIDGLTDIHPVFRDLFKKRVH